MRRAPVQWICYSARMNAPRAVLFDLDDTLAATFEAPTERMDARLIELLSHIPVAIITGRDFARVEPGFLPVITPHAPAGRFFVLAESGADIYEWDGAQWKEEATAYLSNDERKHIRNVITAAVEQTRALEGLPVFGERFVEKRGQVAFAALGLNVPADLKYTWDPQHEKRRALQRVIVERLPEYDVFLGGATSIDVTRKGVNKAAGVRWMAERLSLPVSDMLYVGDAIYPGGNDFVVLETGVPVRQTAGPDETETIVDELLRELA